MNSANQGERIAGWTSPERLSAAERFREQSAAMGTGVTRAVVELAAVGPTTVALDLASGTGEPAISLAAAGAARVVGTDINPELLAIARKRAAERGLRNLEFQVADAHALPFPDAVFDVVTSRLGVMFFSNVVGAMREALRVLKPGGRVALVAWGSFDQPYFASMAGVVLRLFPDPSFRPPVMFRFAEPRSLLQALREAGFERVWEQTRTVDWSWPGTAAEVWQYFRDVSTPLRPLLERIPPQRRAEVDAAVHAEIERYRDRDRIRFGASIVLVSAARPR